MKIRNIFKIRNETETKVDENAVDDVLLNALINRGDFQLNQ